MLAATTARAWDYYQFDLPSQAPEAAWRDALAEKLHARHEVVIEGGRVDVLTDTQAIEIDWPHKWHEGLGQALHYADVTGKQAVLAIISYGRGPDNLQQKSRERLDLVEQTCTKHGVKLIVLFPTDRSAYDTPVSKIQTDSTNYWLNTDTGVRHRPGCRYYENSLNGRPCGAEDGKPCEFCGK